LEDLGFVQALAMFVRPVCRRNNITRNFSTMGDIILPIAILLQIGVYRLAQEALETNEWSEALALAAWYGVTE
jgi:hypothetical protein